MISLTMKFSKAFDKPLNFSDLAENDTPEKLAVFLENNLQDENFEILEDYPVTKTQEGIFVETLSHPGTCIYNIPMLFELANSANISEIKSAVVAAILAHPYVFAKFYQNDEGELRQIRPKEISFSASDISEENFKNLDELKKKFCVHMTCQ